MGELDKLYSTLKSEGYVTKSFEDWREKYENEDGYQRKVFEVISKDGLYTKSFDDFQSKYSVKKKRTIRFKLFSRTYTFERGYHYFRVSWRRN